MIVSKLAEELIKTYLNKLRYLSSTISKEDRGIFPHYWYRPAKITIYINPDNDLAISIDDIVKGKDDRITIKQTTSRIEETYFPRFDYSQKGAFNVTGSGGVEDCVLKDCFFSMYESIDRPPITLSIRNDIRLLRVHVESNLKGYPREKEFLWFLTSPNRAFLTEEKANSYAEKDFFNFLEDLIFRRLDYLLMRKVSSSTLSLLVQAIERLREKYHRLITREDLREQTLQNFLESHYYLLSPQKAITLEKRQIGPFYVDFILNYNGIYELVEIQLNNDPIIKDDSPSEGMKEALKQLEDWFDWIKRNKPSQISKYSGLIVIGRRCNYKKNESKICDLIKSREFPLRLITYDDLEYNMMKIIQLLKTTKESANV